MCVCVSVWSHCDCDGHLKTYEIYVLCVLGLPEHTATHLEIGEQSINQSILQYFIQSVLKLTTGKELFTKIYAQ